MMEFKNIYTLIILLVVVNTSCTKIIELDLPEGAKQTVIEANLFSGTNPFEVKVTETAAYFDNNGNPTINGATVTLNDGTQDYDVPEVGDGIYRIDSFEATPGTTYQLEVDANGTTYTATSTMANPAQLDSVYYEFVEESLFQNEGYDVLNVISDPADEMNYYRIIYTLNDTLRNDPVDYIVLDDQVLNGNTFDIPIFVRQFDLLDTVDIEIRSIDKAMYDYYFVLISLLNSQGGGDSAAPENPPSNFNNNALGYFETAGVIRESIIIVE